MSRAERRSLDELDVLATPPALALAPGEVLVCAGPTAPLATIAEGANPWRLRAVSSQRRMRVRHVDFVHRNRKLIRYRLGRRLGRARLRHVMECAREFFAGLK